MESVRIGAFAAMSCLWAKGKAVAQHSSYTADADFAADVSLSHGDASLLARQVDGSAFSYHGLERCGHATLISDSENLLLHGRRISHRTE